MPRFITCLLVATVTLTGCSLTFAERAGSEGAGQPRYGKPVKVGVMDDKKIDESSGVAWGWRNNVVWTHNDGGKGPWLWALDPATGKVVAQVNVPKARNIDWEDMCSFQRNDKSYLLIADVGDNKKQRATCTLYLIEEPTLPAQGRKRGVTAQVVRVINFRYEDGRHDCEAIAVDPTKGMIILIVKKMGFWCDAYALPLEPKEPEKLQTAEKIGKLEAPVVTGMDISPDGRRAMVCTYGEAWEFTREEGKTWSQAFAHIPRHIVLPQRRQGESICYGADGKTLYVTSERLPAPLWRVPVIKSSDAAETAE